MHAPHAPQTLLSRYNALVAAGVIERDPAQLRAVEALERILTDLASPKPSIRWLAFLPFWNRREAFSGTGTGRRGIYLWGEVGRGKTTLMDLLFEAAPVQRKQRVHFYAFMAQTHARLHNARQNSNGKAGDLVSQVAGELASEIELLCFDEFAVWDIADATILARLFSTLFANGVVVVATSNFEPERLYENGRNRDLFLPFIALLQQRMDVIRVDARADFRLDKDDGGDVYFVVTDRESSDRARERIAALMGAETAPVRTLQVNGRKLVVPQARDKTARFSFAQICGQALGAADYMALTQEFDTIIVDDVPTLDADRRNEAKRLVTLVDVLYEAKTRLVISAAAAPDALCCSFAVAEFPRTASRLVEMRSTDYLRAWAARTNKARD